MFRTRLGGQGVGWLGVCVFVAACLLLEVVGVCEGAGHWWLGVSACVEVLHAGTGVCYEGCLTYRSGYAVSLIILGIRSWSSMFAARGPAMGLLRPGKETTTLPAVHDTLSIYLHTARYCLLLPAHVQDCPQVCKCGYEIKHSPAECPGLCTRCLKYGHTTKDCR
jgi:hypothetical protein